MKRPVYSNLLRFLATMAVGSFIYAAVATVRACFFNTDGGLPLIAGFVLTMLFAHTVGYLLLRKIPVFAARASVTKPVRFLSFMLNLKDAAYSAAAIAAWTLILLPVLMNLLFFMNSGFSRTTFESIVSILAYAVVLKHSQQSFATIMSDKKAYAGFAVLAICLELTYFINKILYLRPWLLGLSYFFILSYLLIKNQEDIDNHIFDKKHIEKSILPRNLRRLNTFWVCMLFLAVVLLFNIKPLVLMILKLLGKVLAYILVAISWLMEQIFPFQASQQQDMGPGGFGFFGSSAELVHPFKNLIINMFQKAFVFYLIYRLLLLILKRIPVLARKIYELVGKLFSFKIGGSTFETADYSDETETVRPVRGQDQKRDLKKKIRKSGRTLKNISDPVERIRYMYASILTMLPLLGVRAEQSDTTAEILEKINAVPKISDELYPFTQIYNHVRYGEKVPDGEMLMTAEGHFGKAVEVIGRK